MQDLDRIEVIRGPGATLWGANAVNGVINIITESAKDTHGTLVSAGGGNVDQGFLSFRYGGGNGHNFNYRVYGKGFTRGSEFHPDNQQFDDWRRTQGGFRTDWDVNRRDTVTIQGDMYSALAGESYRITSLSPPFARIVDRNSDLSGGNVLGRWRRVLERPERFGIERRLRLQSIIRSDTGTVWCAFTTAARALFAICRVGRLRTANVVAWSELVQESRWVLLVE